MEVWWGKAGCVWNAIYLGEQMEEKILQKQKVDRGEQVTNRKNCKKVSCI